MPSVAPEAVAQRLAEAFGADRVTQSSGNQFRFGEEDTRVIAYPHNIEELSAMMKLAHAESWRVAPAGAGTWLEMGNAIVQFHVIVSTAKMARVLEYEPADLTCSVEAGVSLRDFNTQAAEHNQFLPLDPFGDERSTIGATVATASYGPLRAGYGTPRDWLVGCRVVHADGTITSAGGKVVKNVAGYDLCKLYTGSFGTLVVLAELNFKMRALPQADATQVFYADDAAALCALTARLFDSDLQPAALELLSPQTGLPIDEKRFALVLRYVTEEQETVAWQTGEAARLGNGMANTVLSSTDASTFWHAYYTSETSDERCFSLRAAALPTDLGKLIETAQRLMPTAMLRAHAANGVLRIHGSADLLSELRAKHQFKLLIELREFAKQNAKQSGGQMVILRAPDELKKQLDVWGDAGATMALMQGLKKQYDPHNRLNFGRFVAGL